MKKGISLRALLCAIAVALFIAGLALGDGKVTQPQIADPVATWRIIDLRFPLENAQHSAIITVGYFRESGARDHVVEIDASSTDYDSLLYAISTSSGADESTLMKNDGSTDLAAIFRLRISRWMIAHGKIEGVTAEEPTHQPVAAPFVPSSELPYNVTPSLKAKLVSGPHIGFTY